MSGNPRRLLAAAVMPAAVAAVLLACGCAGHQAPPTAASGRVTSSASPTATPMTAADLAWVARAKLTHLGTAARGCSRELRRIGLPSPRLQPAYAIVTKACRTYDKAARCFARAASVSDASGGTFAGTPQARIQKRSIDCGFAAQGNASNRLGDAQSQAQLIESRNP
jgi:hypothetical protein